MSGLIQLYQSNLNKSDFGKIMAPLYALIKDVNADKGGLLL